VVVSCSGAFHDCNGQYSDGCESDLGDAANCGACKNACASGVCGKSISAFASDTAAWSFNGGDGSAPRWDSTSQTLVLTEAGSPQDAASVIYPNAIALDDFDLSFEIRFDISIGRSDGVGFVLERDGAGVVGAPAGGLGMQGLHGWGVELDIFNDGECGDADDNHAGVDSLASCGGGEPTPLATSANLDDSGQQGGGIGDVADGGWRTVQVHAVSGKLTVEIINPGNNNFDQVVLSSVALTGLTLGAPYWFGFSAGTGTLASRQEIRNVNLAFPSNRCL
jgi:hypothetical protein